MRVLLPTDWHKMDCTGRGQKTEQTPDQRRTFSDQPLNEVKVVCTWVSVVPLKSPTLSVPSHQSAKDIDGHSASLMPTQL